MTKEQQAQQKYMELQMMENQMKQIQTQLKQFESQVNDIEQLTIQLNDLKEVKAGTEVFVPVANGIYAKAEIKDTNKLLVNVGASTVTRKTIDETKAILTKQIDELTAARNDLMQKLAQIVQVAQANQEELRNLIE